MASLKKSLSWVLLVGVMALTGVLAPTAIKPIKKEVIIFLKCTVKNKGEYRIFIYWYTRRGLLIPYCSNYKFITGDITIYDYMELIGSKIRKE